MHAQLGLQDKGRAIKFGKIRLYLKAGSSSMPRPITAGSGSSNPLIGEAADRGVFDGVNGNGDAGLGFLVSGINE